MDAIPPPEHAAVATIASLREGSLLWMRDPRRTPVRVLSVREDIASFSVQVIGFEDIGATWSFPLWQVSKFLGDPQDPQLKPQDTKHLAAACLRFDQPLYIAVSQHTRMATHDKLTELTAQALRWLAKFGHTVAALATPPSPPALLDAEAFSTWLQHHDVTHLESAFATQYVSNPHSGEFIKAHRLTLADLGLCPYKGRILRDQDEVSGHKSIARRKSHILARLAFLRAAYATVGQTHVTLYRTISSHEPLTPPRPTGFVSTTFDRQVAQRLYDSAAGIAHRALQVDTIPITRLFMTYLETPQMRAPYEEAEALLLHDDTAALF
ncbi:hypothetical protein J7382_15550 [Shimia sp. R11_0]|uniref:hypothetical protein n=1 Tax=Shimia sp. R11_0 TaxID=2821096 RepID=UPI001ADB41EF|nr:hypothetical protein [Shimia sp. R11_0]MBO9478962.1 hypothetical protein [Shimia sp. R11_0]